MSDPDGFDEVLRDLRRFAERKGVDPKIDDLSFGKVAQMENSYEFSPEDELILGDDYVTYLLFADGQDIGDFSVVAEEDGLQVKTEDFVVKKELGMRVDPEDSSTTYSNGVLSIRLRRISDRDAVA